MVSAAGCYPALASASPFDSGTFRYVLSPPPFAAVQWWTPGFVTRLARVRLAPAAPMPEAIRFPKTPRLSAVLAEDVHRLWRHLTTVVEEKVDGANGVWFDGESLRLQSRGHVLRGGAGEAQFAPLHTCPSSRCAQAAPRWHPHPLTNAGGVRTFAPMSEQSAKPVKQKQSLRDVIEGAITAASEDPDQFVDDVKATARSASGKLDSLLQRLKEHPDLPKRAARNTVIKNFAKKIRKEFRF